MRTALFWVATQRVVVIRNVSGQPSGAIFKGRGYVLCRVVRAAPTLSAGTTLLRAYHRSHCSLYKPRTKVTGFHYEFLTPTDGTARLSRNVRKELPLLAA
jgi:hypothetical protein